MKYHTHCPHCHKPIPPITDAERARAYRARKGATPRTESAKPVYKDAPVKVAGPIEPTKPSSVASMLSRMLDKQA